MDFQVVQNGCGSKSTLASANLSTKYCCGQQNFPLRIYSFVNLTCPICSQYVHEKLTSLVSNPTFNKGKELRCISQMLLHPKDFVIKI